MRIHLLEMPMPGMLGNTNCYLIQHDSRSVLIDTGMSTDGNLDVLHEKLKEHGVTLNDLEQLVCTHYHPDHCGQARLIQQQGVPVMMSSVDAAALQLYFEDPEVDIRRSFFYGEHWVPPDFSGQVAPAFRFLRTLIEPFRPEQVCEDGQTIELAGIPFEVYITPGHTDGHLCLLNREHRILVTGDQILNDSAVNILLSRESLYDVPLLKYMNSLEILSKMGVLSGYPGHGDRIEDVALRCEHLIVSQLQRIRRVEEALMQSPQTAYNIAARAFGVKRRPFSNWLNTAQTISCLEYLVAQNRALSGLERNKRAYTRV